MSRPTRTGNTVRLTETRRVPVKPGDAFAFTADFENISEWDPGVAASTRVDDGKLRVGSVFELEVRFGSRTVPMTYVITILDPNERVVLEGNGVNIKAVDDIRFTPDGTGTRIDYTADLTFGGAIRFALPFIGRQLERVGTRALDGLQRCLTP